MSAKTSSGCEETPVLLSVWGRWKPHFPLPCPPPANRNEMMNPRWEKYLAPPKSYSDIGSMLVRNVSLIKTWLQCDPEMEDQALRKKHAERVNVWRLLLANKSNETYIPDVFRYKSTKSLWDTLCPMKKTRPEDLFEIIDLNDIIPEISIDLCEDVGEVTPGIAYEDVVEITSEKPLDGNKKKQRKGKILCCFGK